MTCYAIADDKNNLYYIDYDDPSCTTIIARAVLKMTPPTLYADYKHANHVAESINLDDGTDFFHWEGNIEKCKLHYTIVSVEIPSDGPITIIREYRRGDKIFCAKCRATIEIAQDFYSKDKIVCDQCAH